MKKNLLLLFVFTTATVIGQQSAEVKNAIDTFNTGELDKGIAMMNTITDKESTSDNWNLLEQMYFTKYTTSKDPSEQLKGIFGLKPPNPADCFNDLINSCRKAELYSESPYASMYLRQFFIDYYPDTVISQSAKDEREKAEDFFGKKDYRDAKLCYQKAIAISPNYYKATLYLGDCYWYLDNMDSAIYFFRKGEEMHPDLLEPKKYLVDALAEDKKIQMLKKSVLPEYAFIPTKACF